MRILILGGDGMLGHQLYQHLSANHFVKVTLHQDFSHYASHNIFSEQNSFCKIDIRNHQSLEEVFADFKPEAVINAIGLIKHRPSTKDVLLNLEVNALFPHRLSLLCKLIGARLVHMSTDCVFDGRKGGYLESDYTNAEDVYGKTKFLGELHEAHTITLRTSIIGFELNHKQGLMEWVISQKGQVKGFKNATYTGFTTLEMARIIERVLINYPNEFGLFQVASEVINKYELICLMARLFELNLDIIEDENFTCYRHLNGEKFNKTFNYVPPSWYDMIAELAEIYRIKKERAK